MMLLGIGEALKIVLIVKAVATPIALQTHLGVRDIDPQLIEVARVLRLGALTRVRRLIVPSAMPAFLTGLRLGLAQAWVSLVAVELLASSEGIGFLMVWGRQLFQLDVVFVCMIVIGAVGLTMDLILQVIEPWVVRWPSPAISRLRDAAIGKDRRLAWMLPAGLLVIWIAVSLAGKIDARLLPAPTTIAVTLFGGIADGSMPSALVASLARSCLGLAIGGAVGLGVGLAMGLVPWLRSALSATVTALRLVAIFAWLPLITAWVGLGDGAKVTFIAIACFFPMQVATERGVRALSPQLIEVARIMRLAPIARLRFLVLPGAAPAIFGGLRLALIVSWIAAFGADYFLAGNGIGNLMISAEQGFRSDIVIACMVLVALTAAGIGAIGQAIEARATRWRTA
jgi:sulfonate transport system permease protein